jgi:hypothetical protein
MKSKKSRMKMTNKHQQVTDPDGFDEGTYRLAVWNEFFATNTRRVRTKTDERAPAAGGTK